MARWYDFPKYKAEDVCRHCGHFAKFHLSTDWVSKPGKLLGIWSICNRKDIGCECLEFGPEDNLEYLEVKSER